MASPMSYANDIEIADKSETFFAYIAFYLKDIEPDPDLFFKAGDTVPVPDIHGDFVHLILTLHRHGLLDCELNLKKDFKYVFLGDFYNRGKDARIVDYWLNKQISDGAKIYRIAGNHELFFLARDKDGKVKFKLRDPRDGKLYQIQAYDVENDVHNNHQVVEGLLKSIKDGNLLAAYTLLDTKHNIPVLYAHTFVTSTDQKRLNSDEEEIVTFVQNANERFKNLGQESYEKFMASKSKEQFDWEEISAPLFSEPLFNIFYRDKNKRVDAFFMRIPGLDANLRIISKVHDELPSGVYQIVGHTKVPDFNLPEGIPRNRPLIIPSENGKGFVQFSDIGMGLYYKENIYDRPEVTINPEMARGVEV